MPSRLAAATYGLAASSLPVSENVLSMFMQAELSLPISPAASARHLAQWSIFGMKLIEPRIASTSSGGGPAISPNTESALGYTGMQLIMSAPSSFIRKAASRI